MPGFKTIVSVSSLTDTKIEASIYVDWFLYNIIVTADLNLKYTIKDKVRTINNVSKAIKFKEIEFETIPIAYKAIFSDAIIFSVKKKIENEINK